MAKAQKASDLFDIADLNSFLTKEVNTKGGLIHELDEAPTEYISTGIFALDALLSGRVLDGGITNDRFVGIGGESGTGKTFLALNLCRAAQRQGYFIIYIDSEGNIKEATTEAFGIDPKMFRLDKIRIVEDYKVYMAKMIAKFEAVVASGKKLPKMLIVLDSLGNLASKKEVDDAQNGDQKQDMTRAKQLKSIFRIITAQLSELSIPLVATNHTYMCLTAGHELLLADGTKKLIEQMQVGDMVETLAGPKPVVSTTKYVEAPTVKLTLETGEVLHCTPNHKFLVEPDWNADEEDACWKRADELAEEDCIYAITTDR